MQRMRRLRVNENMRSLVRETSVEISDLVYPIFVEEGENIAEPIPSMPGINRYSIDRIDEELDRVAESGVKSLLIFQSIKMNVVVRLIIIMVLHSRQ